MRKHVRVGTEFEINAREIQKIEDSRTRGFLARLLAFLVTFFLLGAGAVGLFRESFNELKEVWIAIGPLVALILGYYFGSLAPRKGEGDPNA